MIEGRRSALCCKNIRNILIFLILSYSTIAQTHQKGTASYYNDSLEGNRTASGEIFHQGKFTAAHKTLPFGTWVLVTDSEKHEVVIRINDRLPANSSRMIDLTTQAARELKMIRKGLIKVRIEVVSASEAWMWYIRHGYLVVGL